MNKKCVCCGTKFDSALSNEILCPKCWTVYVKNEQIKIRDKMKNIGCCQCGNLDAPIFNEYIRDIGEEPEITKYCIKCWEIDGPLDQDLLKQLKIDGMIWFC